MTSGVNRVSPGLLTAGRGQNRRACMLARTSFASSTPGLTASYSPTAPISSLTWPTRAKTTSGPRSPPGTSRPTASNTSAEGDKTTGRSRGPDRQCRAGQPPASSRWAGGLSFHRDPPFQHQHRFLYGPQPKLIPLAPCTFPGWSCASRLRGAGQRFWRHDWIWADQWLRWFAVSRATAASTSSPACRFSGRVTRMGVRCDGADSVTWGSGWASFQDC